MEDSDNQIFILYVDDEAILLEATKQYLENIGGCQVETVSSAKDALNRIHGQEFDAVVSDYQMPEMDGLEFLRTLRAEGNDIPFIIFTGRGREEVAIEALNAGADYYLQKGGKPKVQFGELQNIVRQAVKKYRAEKEILEHEQRMADIINFLPDATLAIDKEGRVIAWNRAIEEMVGTPASDVLGKGNFEYAFPFYGVRRPMLIDIVLHEELQYEVSYPVLNCQNLEKCYAEIFLPHLRDGEGAHLWFKASPLYDADGSVAGAIESIRDITDYKQAEGLYQTVFENTGTAMLILEEDTTISHVNDEMEQLWGYAREEKEGTAKWPELVVDEDREKTLEYHRLRRTDPDSVPKNYEFRLIHKNGEIKTAALNAAMIPGTKKSIISLIDITEQKEAEKQLKFTQFVVDNAADVRFWVDYDGRFISVNNSIQNLLGYSKEEFLALSIPEIDPNYPPHLFRELWDEMKEDGSLIIESSVPKKGGGFVSIEISMGILSYEGQEFACGFIRDITDRNKA